MRNGSGNGVWSKCGGYKNLHAHQHILGNKRQQTLIKDNSFLIKINSNTIIMKAQALLPKVLIFLLHIKLSLKQNW